LLKAVNGVDISSEVPGIVSNIGFKSGQVVASGLELVALDDRVDQAVLNDAKANLSLTELTFKRNQELVERGATTRSALDNARAKLQQARASVEKAKALIAQKHISAPFAGVIGIRQVDVGQYISPGQKIVSLQSLDPLRVQFRVPEQSVEKIQLKQEVKLRLDAKPNKPYHAVVTALDANADPNTHMVLVEATVANARHDLYPGMFANVNVLLTSLSNVVTVPATAVAYSLSGDSVFVIESQAASKKDAKPKLLAKRRFVRVGEQREGRVVILEGVKAGEQVVTSGQLKLHNNAPVVINNDVSLSTKAKS